MVDWPPPAAVPAWESGLQGPRRDATDVRPLARVFRPVLGVGAARGAQLSGQKLQGLARGATTRTLPAHAAPDAHMYRTHLATAPPDPSRMQI